MNAEPFLGEVAIFAGSFPPRGWAFCEGQILQINSNQALFSLLGTTYGGDGRTTFALPDLRGRFAVGEGQGPGLPNVRSGEKSGTETNTLSPNQLPAHTHSVAPRANSGNGKQSSPKTNFPATVVQGATTANAYSASFNSAMVPITSTSLGNGQAVNNRAPYLALRFLIALVGTFPSRN